MFAPKSILVPTDFSVSSDLALSHAIDIAKQYDARVHLLHVVGLVRQCSMDYCLNGDTILEIEKQSLEGAASMMKEQIFRVPGAKEIGVITDVKQGIPYEEILREQAGAKIDLVVIGSRGKTGLFSHFGSVADNVGRRAECPVLIVKIR
jgi:universal stress protein A